MAHRRPGLRPGRLARRLVGDLPGGDVGGDRGQFRIGPRPECLAYPRIKLVFGNPTSTNAALSMSITCSRSAWDALRRLRPAAATAILSSGSAVTRASPTITVQRSLARRRYGGRPRQPRRPNGGAGRANSVYEPGASDDGASDENRTRTVSLGICADLACMWADLGCEVSGSDREIPLVAGVNGPLMARR